MKLFTASFALLCLQGCSADPTPVATDASLQPDGRADASADGSDATGDVRACTLLKAYSSKNVVCNQCAQANCCAEINGCFADPKCDDDYVNCILACALLPGDAGDAGVKSCLDQCAKDQPQGKAEYDVAIGCADTKCAVECK